MAFIVKIHSNNSSNSCLSSSVDIFHFKMNPLFVIYNPINLFFISIQFSYSKLKIIPNISRVLVHLFTVFIYVSPSLNIYVILLYVKYLNIFFCF